MKFFFPFLHGPGIADIRKSKSFHDQYWTSAPCSAGVTWTNPLLSKIFSPKRNVGCTLHGCFFSWREKYYKIGLLSCQEKHFFSSMPLTVVKQDD